MSNLYLSLLMGEETQLGMTLTNIYFNTVAIIHKVKTKMNIKKLQSKLIKVKLLCRFIHHINNLHAMIMSLHLNSDPYISICITSWKHI